MGMKSQSLSLLPTLQAQTQALWGWPLTPLFWDSFPEQPQPSESRHPGLTAFAQCSVVATQTVTVTHSTHFLSICQALLTPFLLCSRGKDLEHSRNQAEASLLSGPEPALAICAGFPAGI